MLFSHYFLLPLFFIVFVSTIHSMDNYTELLSAVYGNDQYTAHKEAYDTIICHNQTTGEKSCITPWKSQYKITELKTLPAHFLAEYIKRNQSLLDFLNEQARKQSTSKNETIITILHEYLRIADCAIHNSYLTTMEDMYLGTHKNGNTLTFFKKKNSEENFLQSEKSSHPTITLSELIIAAKLDSLTTTAIENSPYPLPKDTYKILFFADSYPKKGTTVSVRKSSKDHQYKVNYTPGNGHYYDYKMVNIISLDPRLRELHWNNRISLLHKPMNHKTGERQINDIHVVKRIVSFLVPTNQRNNKPLLYNTPILLPYRAFKP